MKVVMVNGSGRWEYIDVLIQMNGSELRRLLGREYHEKPPQLKAGDQIEICERFNHVLEIERQVKEAETLPQKLRTLAELLEMHHPALREVVTTDEPLVVL